MDTRKRVNESKLLDQILLDLDMYQVSKEIENEEEREYRIYDFFRGYDLCE